MSSKEPQAIYHWAATRGSSFSEAVWSSDEGMKDYRSLVAEIMEKTGLSAVAVHAELHDRLHAVERKSQSYCTVADEWLSELCVE